MPAPTKPNTEFQRPSRLPLERPRHGVGKLPRRYGRGKKRKHIAKRKHVITPHRLSPKHKLCLKRLKRQAQQPLYNRSDSPKRLPRKPHGRRDQKPNPRRPSWEIAYASCSSPSTIAKHATQSHGGESADKHQCEPEASMGSVPYVVRP